MTTDNQLKVFASKVNWKLDNLLPASVEIEYPDIGSAMRYSLLIPGKRIRAFLTKVIATMFEAEDDNILTAACITEIIHCYSLIHDDLPALDNDDLRRGKPSNHKVFGESTAILAGDALLTFAFEVIASDSFTIRADDKIFILQMISKSAGYQSLIYGQVLDLNLAKRPVDTAHIIKIHECKTASMFQAACNIGAAIGKVKPTSEQWKIIQHFATKFGLLFQLVDDWQDQAQEEETNLVKTIGARAAQQMADSYLEDIIHPLSQLPVDHREELQDLAHNLHQKISNSAQQQ